MDENQLNTYIHLCRQGDTKAFEHLVVKYQQMVYTLAFRLMCDQGDAEDVTQEVFVKVWRSISSYRESYKFSTWVYKITCNVCYDKLRSRRSRKEIRLVNCEIHSAEPNVEDSIHNQQLRELIIVATEGLSPKQKLVFVLSEIDDLEVDQIRTITGMTAAQIKSNLYLARRYIKNKLQKR